MIGAFGLQSQITDQILGMETNYKDMGDYLLLNGAKMWITMPHFVILPWVVWQKVKMEK